VHICVSKSKYLRVEAEVEGTAGDNDETMTDEEVGTVVDKDVVTTVDVNGGVPVEEISVVGVLSICFTQLKVKNRR
jgi:hypothetical protein